MRPSAPAKQRPPTLHWVILISRLQVAGLGELQFACLLCMHLLSLEPHARPPPLTWGSGQLADEFRIMLCFWWLLLTLLMLRNSQKWARHSPNLHCWWSQHCYRHKSFWSWVSWSPGLTNSSINSCPGTGSFHYIMEHFLIHSSSNCFLSVRNNVKLSSFRLWKHYFRILTRTLTL